jgi:hypothetical protein
VHIVLPPIMHATWVAMAHAEGQTLSGWIKWVCNQRAARLSRRPRPPRVTAISPDAGE